MLLRNWFSNWWVKSKKSQRVRERESDSRTRRLEILRLEERRMTAADIEVFDGSRLLRDNASFVSLGSVVAGETSQLHAITVKNNTNAQQTFQPVYSSNNAIQFPVNFLPNQKIAAGSSFTLFAQLNSNYSTGFKTSTIQLSTSVYSVSSFRFTAEGAVTTGGIVIDDLDSGFSKTGVNALWDTPPGYGGSMFRAKGSGSATATATATWKFSNLTPGQYYVDTTYFWHAGMTGAAKYTIKDGGTGGTIIATPMLNQRATPNSVDPIYGAGGVFARLATVTITSSTLVVQVSNAGFSSSYYVAADAIQIVPLVTNRAPKVTSSTVSLLEQSPNGTVVGSVAASDPDVGQSLTWSFGGGNTNNAFAINSANGRISVLNSAALNYATTPSFNLTVVVTDNGAPVKSTTGYFTVNLTRPNQTPIVTTTTVSLLELSANGTVVGAVPASDPDVGQTLTWSIIGGNTNNAFTVNSTNGRVSVQNSAALNYATTPTFNLVVMAMDSGSPVKAGTGIFTVNLTRANQKPTDISLTGGSVPENSQFGTNIGVLSTTDPDVSQIFSYELVTGLGSTDNARFQVNGNTLQTAASLDFEAQAAYSVRIRTVDQGGLSFERIFTINAIDVNEAPQISLVNLVGSVYRSSNIAARVKIADLSLSDDALGSNALSVIGANAATFEIIGNELFIKEGVTLVNNSTLQAAGAVDDPGIAGTPDAQVPFEVQVLADPVTTFDPAGSEFQINVTTSGHQTDPAVAHAADGSSVVVWGDNNRGIFARRYNAAGQPVGGEWKVSTVVNSEEVNPAVAMSADGRFVITWTSLWVDGSAEGISARLFDAQGTPVTGDMIVNTRLLDSQRFSSVAMHISGSFIVTWQSDHQDDANGCGIHAQRFAADGSRIGGEILVNTTTDGDQRHSSIAIAEDGGFAIVWQSNVQEGSGYGVYVQRYTSAGVPIGSEVQVNANISGDQVNAAIAMAPNGSHMITWTSDTGDGSGDGILGRIFSPTGIPVGNEFVVTTHIYDNQRFSAVAATQQGGWVATWQSDHQDDANGVGIHAKFFSGSGEKLGGELLVNTVTDGDQRYPSVAISASGDVTIVWQSESQDGSGYGIFGRRFRLTRG